MTISSQHKCTEIKNGNFTVLRTVKHTSTQTLATLFSLAF